MSYEKPVISFQLLLYTHLYYISDLFMYFITQCIRNKNKAFTCVLFIYVKSENHPTSYNLNLAPSTLVCIVCCRYFLEEY
jgi:hypothetical protein